MAISRAREARRDDLIERLMEIFLADGFFDTSIGELAAELKCSKTTLYTIADSKEQIIVAVVHQFFRRAARRIEERIADVPAGSDRIRAYLVAISEELAPASETFFRDVDMFAPTREIYHRNTQFAAGRLHELVLDAVPETSRTQAIFMGAVAGHVMEAIHRGQIEDATSLDDSSAYLALADLIVAGVSASRDRPTPPRTKENR